MKKVRAAVFASGTGSNFQAIMEAGLHDDVALLVCDKPGAAVIDLAQDFAVPTFVFDPKHYDSKADYESAVLEHLRGKNITWVFLAGYMRIIGPTLLNAYPDKMINIHPSLLPDFPGKDAIGQAYEAGVSTTGVTVHYIDDGVDTGPIITQQKVSVFPDDTKEILTNRIQQMEHKLYPQVIQQLMKSEQ
ncbi:phosphoribosylglycinamide formyltransferase-1 [Lentibacillus halodurans]|uniref:Phosphoribosylglycinamide formyltransferase n=1 Tax=Lentibacillus halodurans TaxID=237679 RepID=A0A1I0YRQ0_9BACI|nr:phosphoribosylglycinamide formyltransferase [Lentibacillus halodurans]SFB15120.1 phosphoribosylglycinamide formyltransferase-1 [Lentibacillus halodurans]